MPESSVSVSEAARFLNVSEEEAKGLSDAGGNVPLETVRSLAGTAAIARELAGAREEVGRLSGQLGEVRASNVRLQKDLKDSQEERRRLTEEVLELMARVEQELEESSSELERLRNRRLLGRLLNR